MSNPGGRQGGSDTFSSDLTQYSLRSSNFSVPQPTHRDHLSSVSYERPSGDGQTAQPQYSGNQTAFPGYSQTAGWTSQQTAQGGPSTAAGGYASSAAPQPPSNTLPPELAAYKRRNSDKLKWAKRMEGSGKVLQDDSQGSTYKTFAGTVLVKRRNPVTNAPEYVDPEHPE
ncbi:hypothetical protein L204_105956 [Cryptococcus depauperatus]|nr:hypothetical protein L204_05079 [Cryptococcus depauperatus CBS 7855]